MKSTLSCEIDGKMIVVTVSHPAVPESRKQAIKQYLDTGCELVPNVDELPKWLHTVPAQAQASLLDLKPELFKFYKLHIPRDAAITSNHWTNLAQLQELRHLSVASTKLTPHDLANTRFLLQLEVLVLHSAVFNDEFCFAFPRMNSVRMIDIIGTAVSPSGVLSMQNACPNAKIYCDYDMTT